MAEQEESEKRGLSYEVAQRILGLQGKRETQAAFARRIGLSPQTVSNYQQKENGASLEAVATVVRRTHVSPRFLLTGQEPVEGVDPSEADLRMWLARKAVEGDLEELRAMLPKPAAVGAGKSTKPSSPDETHPDRVAREEESRESRTEELSEEGRKRAEHEGDSDEERPA